MRRVEATPDALADWLDEVARTVRRGASSSTALAAVPADRRLALDTILLRRALSRGVSVATATDDWRARHDVSAGVGRAPAPVSICSAVISCAAEVGGSLAEPVDRLAAAMRERAELDRERHTHGAQARLSAIVLSCLPIGVLAALLIADDEVRQVITSPLGAAVVGVGAGLDAAGAWWMHRIVAATR